MRCVCLFAHCVVHRVLRPPFRWFCIGPKRSGTTVHTDPLGTAAWNAVTHGVKHWVLFEPQESRRVVKGKDFIHEGEDDEAIMYYDFILPRIKRAHPEVRVYEGLQKPGDLIFVPGDWWHAVLNIEDCVAVTQNYVGPDNFDMVWKKTRKEREKLAYLWLRNMRKFAPRLPCVRCSSVTGRRRAARVRVVSTWLTHAPCVGHQIGSEASQETFWQRTVLRSCNLSCIAKFVQSSTRTSRLEDLEVVSGLEFETFVRIACDGCFFFESAVFLFGGVARRQVKSHTVRMVAELWSAKRSDFVPCPGRGARPCVAAASSWTAMVTYVAPGVLLETVVTPLFFFVRVCVAMTQFVFF